ncbi:hypothetical protein C0J50_16836 [Silurus asotus]|uniref:Uncharacterized protein n=1 Tax=Silurus asotus TaxID=30991 RepID=A0AAD5FNK7_SILAS|nr:hypothetical protein C0J50_16836 [Silurus asotus]
MSEGGTSRAVLKVQQLPDERGFYSNKKVESTSLSESEAVRKPCESRVFLLIPVNKVDFLEIDVQNIRLRQRTRGEAPMRACRQAERRRAPTAGVSQNVSTAGESNVHAPVLSGENYHGPVTMNFTTTTKT